MEASPNSPAFVLEAISGNKSDAAEVEKELSLLFLGCEELPPYGPYEHTARLFLDLFVRALDYINASPTKVLISGYRVSQGQFPPSSAYDVCDGVILPGSFNSAYDQEPWILQLSSVIQEELVAKERPTLGVCFGHQIFSHSFPDGLARKCPAGAQAGRRRSTLTEHGEAWLGDETKIADDNGLELFYTHGDMVETLPSQGKSLGGTNEVPIQAAIYFSQKDSSKPIALTFQAHPEYGSSVHRGLNDTLSPIMKTMAERGDIPEAEFIKAEADASETFASIETNSIQTLVAVGRHLGWFPKKQ